MKTLNITLPAALSILAISGCVTVTETKPRSTAELLQESQTALDTGKIEKAVSLLDEASRNAPADALPWLKQAQVHFDADNYPAAIQAADEAMKRDPSSKEAKAIAVVASLRVAVRALADMNQDSLLRGSSRTEAERLARALRETLALDQLVPIEPSKSNKRTTNKPRTPASRQSSGGRPPTQPPRSGNTGGNPFGSLR